MHHLAPRLLALLALASATLAQGRVPGERWMRFADAAEAGFDAEKLASAQRTWEALDSSAFMVVADGAVIAAWGDVERRFMCHSVRKSFLSALYGIYWDRGELELNKTLADLGLDDAPSPLLETEKRARILDLLKARSGVFHPAAYAGRTDGAARGSEGPGRFFAYNNWDFNTLAAILKQETGAEVFGAFDEHFGGPLGMQDWRVSDGYYHYELDKSIYPAYPFRMSARDAARFGLLFAREGKWGDESILSRHWVSRSTGLYSIDNEVMGYGFMWWVFLEPRFETHGMVSALGVGNQMIAALPDSDIVIVNRANTYLGEGTPMGPLLDLIEEVLAARTGEAVEAPRLVPLEDVAPMAKAEAGTADLAEFVGEWSDPPAGLGLGVRDTLEVRIEEEELVWSVPGWGTYRLWPRADGTFVEEDSQRVRYAVRDGAGKVIGITDAGTVVEVALALGARGQAAQVASLLAPLEVHDPGAAHFARSLLPAFSGDPGAAEEALQALARERGAREVEGRVNGIGYGFLQGGEADHALVLLELNTRVFESSPNVWDSLAEAHLALGNLEDALEFYAMTLAMDEDNPNAKRRVAELEARLGKER